MRSLSFSLFFLFPLVSPSLSHSPCLTMGGRNWLLSLYHKQTFSRNGVLYSFVHGSYAALRLQKPLQSNNGGRSYKFKLQASACIYNAIISHSVGGILPSPRKNVREQQSHDCSISPLLFKSFKDTAISVV